MSEALIRLHIEELPEGVFLATSEDVPGLVAQGRTVAEAVEIAQDVARKLAESYRAHGEPLPPALQRVFSGRGEVVAPVAVDA
ncbi:MAG: type II toxin-antitoxin system HicB family antitoxin [Bacillota bacterium]|nr:type II toxin-antitoxin system HicB family antitoxin [Bacillota bacterium]